MDPKPLTGYATAIKLIIICNSTGDYLSLEQGTYSVIDVLRILSYGVFIWDVNRHLEDNNNIWPDNLLKLYLRTIIRKIRKKESQKPDKETEEKESKETKVLIVILCIIILCIMVSLIIVPTAIYGLKRYERCLNESDSRGRNTIAHTVIKSSILMSTLVTSSCAAIILGNSKYKWERTQNDSDDSMGNTSSRFYDLYHKYTEIGKSARPERRAVRRWFVLMYFISFLYILGNIVHMVKLLDVRTFDKETEWPDLVYLILNILIHFFAFVVPYCMGSWLNNAHHEYYTNMIEVYLEKEMADIPSDHTSREEVAKPEVQDQEIERQTPPTVQLEEVLKKHL